VQSVSGKARTEAARLEVVLPSDARAGGYRSQDAVRATVATTWSLSIEVANALPPPGAARAVPVVASLLDPNDIPLELLTTTSAVRACRHLAGDDSSLSGEDLLDALDHLARFSLADLNTSWRVRVWFGCTLWCNAQSERPCLSPTFNPSLGPSQMDCMNSGRRRITGSTSPNT
jgi:hypothetical protein